MSYFAFGLASFEKGVYSDPTTPRAALEQSADRAGFSVTLDGLREPSILAEMRGQYPATELAFFCAGRSNDDTSDELISPHAVGLDGSERGLGAIAEWIHCAFVHARADRVRLWLTEGWDDSFEKWNCSPEDLGVLLQRRLREEGDVPSMHIIVEREGS